MTGEPFPYERRVAPTTEESLALIARQMQVLRRRLDEHEHQSNELIRVTNDLRDVADARRAIGVGVRFLLWVSGIALALVTILDVFNRFKTGSP